MVKRFDHFAGHHWIGHAVYPFLQVACTGSYSREESFVVGGRAVPSMVTFTGDEFRWAKREFSHC